MAIKNLKAEDKMLKKGFNSRMQMEARQTKNLIPLWP